MKMEGNNKGGAADCIIGTKGVEGAEKKWKTCENIQNIFSNRIFRFANCLWRMDPITFSALAQDWSLS